MATETAAPWQEIIPPAPPPLEAWVVWSWLIGLLLCAALLAWLGWRWWRQPRRAARRTLARIRHRLESGDISPRAGLYAAAACLPTGHGNASQALLLQQRYARPEPERGQVMQLLQELQKGLAS